MTTGRLLVPVSDSETLRNTVAYAVREASDRDDGGAVHFVYPLSRRATADEEPAEVEEARDLLGRVATWAAEDLGEAAGRVTVETALVGADEYLFSPGDYATVLARYADAHDLAGAVFDPRYAPTGTTPLLPTLEAEVRRTGLAVETAPVERPRRSSPLVRRGTIEQFLVLFGISYAFYLVLAGSLVPFELATGAMSAAVVAVALWRVTLTGPVRPARAARQFARLALYVPFLVWEIAKANVQIAYVVLHPDLPIDPEVVEFDAAVWSPLPVATLANSITLTPGTLTVDVTRQHFTVHTLTRGAREDLLAGGLERAVRAVFYGRSAARIASPDARETDEDRSAADAGDDHGGDGASGAPATSTDDEGGGAA